MSTYCLFTFCCLSVFLLTFSLGQDCPFLKEAALVVPFLFRGYGSLVVTVMPICLHLNKEHILGELVVELEINVRGLI